MKVWYTLAELAELKLPGLPTTERGVQALADRESWRDRKNLAGGPLARRRQGRGGGWEYHYTLLPIMAQAKLVRDAAPATAAAPAAENRAEIWDFYETLPDKRKATAERRLHILQSVKALEKGGLQKNIAVAIVGGDEGVGSSTIYTWFNLVAGVARIDWLPNLAPRHAGRARTVECDPRAWEFLKADYLRQSRPSFATCFERLRLAAAEHGWPIPSSRTLERRIERDIPAAVTVLLRDGSEALRRMFPHQERDRTMFHALEAVNADGHKWDVFVRWHDGTIGRPIMMAVQDLYSNKILAWRIDRTENSDLVRLTFADVFREYGLPDLCWLDNGRGFASKFITGGTPNRYRFKVKAEEPSGILTSLGVEVHWARPYAGQSKPIERAFRDLCDAGAKHPAFEGAYTGNKPDAKPENYGDRAVPIDEFLKVVGQVIRLHNARPNRNTRVCGRSRSFDEAFAESYAAAIIRKASDAQLRMCLLAAENVSTDRRNGAVTILGNRYWGDCLHNHIGTKLTVRFDPDNLHAGVHLYRLDGAYIGAAECLEAQGFKDSQAAREHARKLKQFRRATNDAAALERQLTNEELLGLLPDIDEAETPETKIARIFTAADAVRADPPAAPAPLTAAQEAVQDTVIANLAAHRAAKPRTEMEMKRDRFERACGIEADIAAGAPVDPEDARWLGGYQATAEYRAQMRMFGNSAEQA